MCFGVKVKSRYGSKLFSVFDDSLVFSCLVWVKRNRQGIKVRLIAWNLGAQVTVKKRKGKESEKVQGALEVYFAGRSNAVCRGRSSQSRLGKRPGTQYLSTI